MGHAALTTSIQEFGQPTHAPVDHSFLTTSIEAAEFYLAGRITDARLYQALSQVERELKAFLDGAEREKEILNGKLNQLTAWSQYYFFSPVIEACKKATETSMVRAFLAESPGVFAFPPFHPISVIHCSRPAA